MIPDLLGMIFNCDVVEMSVRAAMGEKIDAHEMDGTPYYATLNLHSDRVGKYKRIEFDRVIENYIIRKNIYKKSGDDVNYFANAADALGIVFFKFPNQETMISLEEHMNEHVRIVLEEDE